MINIIEDGLQEPIIEIYENFSGPAMAIYDEAVNMDYYNDTSLSQKSNAIPQIWLYISIGICIVIGIILGIIFGKKSANK